MPDTILVATDGSDTGRRAVEFAARLSKDLGHPLCIVHVLMHGRPDGEYRKMAEVEGLAKPGKKRSGSDSQGAVLDSKLTSPEDEIEDARIVMALGEYIVTTAKNLAEELGARDVTTQICAGDIADEILEVSEFAKATILVLGRRGLGRVREVLLGSVSQKVLHHAKCKVVIVP